MSALNCSGIESGGCAELHGAFGRVLVRRGEGDDDDVPLRRDLAKRNGGTRGAVAGPVADELMAVGRTGQRGSAATVGLDGARPRRPPRAGHGLAGSGRRLRVGEAVSARRGLRRGRCTRAAGRRSAGDRWLRRLGRRRPSRRGCCSSGSCWWVRAGSRWSRRRCRRRPPWSPGRIQPGKAFPGTLTLRPWTRGSWSGSLTNSRELLSERLHVSVFHDGGRGVEIGAEDERVSGGGVDAVRSPGAADGGVAEGVVGGVVRHGDDELAVLLGDLLEELLLQELEVDDGEGAAGLLRGEDVAVAHRDGDLDGLHLRACRAACATRRRSGKVVRSMASAYCVVPPDGKENSEKTGERSTRGTSGAASRRKGLPAVFFASKESVMGTSTVGMVVVPPCAGSRPTRV